MRQRQISAAREVAADLGLTWGERHAAQDTLPDGCGVPTVESQPPQAALGSRIG